MTLLEQIQNEAVDGSSDLATVLRKCRVLSAKLKNDQFTEWVTHELDGYFGTPTVPDYRILHGQCFGTFVGPYGSGARNVPLRESEIVPEARKRLVTMELREGVAGIQTMFDGSRKSDESVRMSWPADFFGFYQTETVAPHLVLVQAWTQISDNMLAAVLSTIRNRILNFILEIMEENPNAGEAPIGSRPVTPDKTAQIFYNTINVHGNVGNFAGGNVGSQISSAVVKPGDFQSLKEFLRQVGLGSGDIAELEAAIHKEPEVRSIDAGQETSAWLAKMKQKIASGVITFASSAGTAGATELLKQGIDLFFSIEEPSPPEIMNSACNKFGTTISTAQSKKACVSFGGTGPADSSPRRPKLACPISPSLRTSSARPAGARRSQA